MLGLPLISFKGPLAAPHSFKNKQSFNEIDWKSARLSLKAYRSVQKTGQWKLEDVEGQIPSEISGTLLRVGPGLKENHDTRLKHFFDGDALFQAIRFKDGQATIHCDFIDTPHRKEELEKGRMLYNEFGTMAPKRTRELKNQPNISIIPWRGDYLALSEGGHPILLDGKDLSFKEVHDFKGTLPNSVGFTAHPKIDPETGKGYAFGIKQGASMALHIYEMDPDSGELEELYRLPQSKVFMIHDFMVGKDTIAFMIPPAYFKLSDIIFNRGSMADALTYDASLGNRLIILDKKKGGSRRELTLPAAMSFHCGNLYEEGDEIVFTVCQARDGSLLSYIANWQEGVYGNLSRPDIIEWRVDKLHGRVLSKRKLASSHDFPFFNRNYLGKKSEYLYAANMGDKSDPMRFSGVTKINLAENLLERYEAREYETFGEPVFHPLKEASSEDQGYLFIPGYSEKRNESFIKILNSQSMKEVCCLWLGAFIPVGFHGHFMS